LTFLRTNEVTGVKETRAYSGRDHHGAHVPEIQHQGFRGYNEPEELKN
jgi:hypothetical protein